MSLFALTLVIPETEYSLRNRKLVYLLALPYNRGFKTGRGSAQLYGDELHQIYEAHRHLLDEPGYKKEPVAKLHGAQWHNQETNELKYFDKAAGKWRNYYEDKFKITENILSVLPPSDPVPGEMWIHQGVMCYYNGVSWTPIKALMEDGSQFSLDCFRNFILVSPLWTVGNTVIDDDQEMEVYYKARRQIEQNVLDSKADATVTGDGTKWTVDHDCQISEAVIPNALPDSKAQLIVPYVDMDRIFLDHDLDAHKYEQVSEVCVQYKREDLFDRIPSVIHMNPGRLSKITKRIIKVDRNNPRVRIFAENTEFYGFRANQRFGELLIPDSAEKLADYTPVEDGILLSYNASQNYDYVVAITYEFSWMKTTGRMTKASSHDEKTCYYVDNFMGPLNVFVEGLDLEDPYFETDEQSHTVTIKQKAAGLEVGVMHSPHREYGYVRQIDLQGRAVIRPLHDYNSPLVFINGEAVHPVFGDIVYENEPGKEKRIYVPGANYEQMWSVVELFQQTHDKYALGAGKEVTHPCNPSVDNIKVFVKDASGDYVVATSATCTVTNLSNGVKIKNNTAKIADIMIQTDYNAFLDAGLVNSSKKISFNTSVVSSDDTVVLFVDGLLVKKEDIVIDRAKKTITVAGGGLHEGQEYILLRDAHGWLYNEKALTPALPVGKFIDSLVYFNGKLLCNSTALDTLKTEEEYVPVFNEVKCFKQVYLDENEREVVNRTYKLYNIDTGKWDALSQSEIDGLTYFAYGYENTLRSVRLTFDYGSADDIHIYAFNTANSIEHPLFVKSVDVTNEKNIPTSMEYIANKNTLRVWCNGVRQYPATDKYGGIVEYTEGTSFDLPVDDPYKDKDGNWQGGFTGRVTYTIELPENERDMPCTMEVLDETNTPYGYANMYKTKQPLYPGRVTVYVNGVRLSPEDFQVLDNYTLAIDSGEDNALIGNWKNYPDETVQKNCQEYKLHHKIADVILVEVRQDDRQEATIQLKGHPVFEINAEEYDIDSTILEAADEIMIFADGLYFGPKDLDGYIKNPLRGTISITNDEILSTVNTDEEYMLLDTHQDDKSIYNIKRDGKVYKQYNAKLTFEWR